MADKEKTSTGDAPSDAPAKDTTSKPNDKDPKSAKDTKDTKPIAKGTKSKPKKKKKRKTKKSKDSKPPAKKVEKEPEVGAESESETLSSSDEEEDLLPLDPKSWDNTFKLAPFLDNHFILVLVDSLKNQKRLLQLSRNAKTDDVDSKEETVNTEHTYTLVGEQLMTLYDDAELTEMEFKLLSTTCLVDLQNQISLELESTSSNQNKISKIAKTRSKLPKLKLKVVEQLEHLEEVCGPVLDLVQDNESADDYIDSHDFDVDQLLSYCKLRYEVGVYQNTDVLLQHYRNLTVDPEKKKHALWGILSAQILQNKWDDAHRTLGDIQKVIDNSSTLANINRAEDEDEDDEDIYNKMAEAQLEGNEAEVERLEALLKQQAEEAAQAVSSASKAKAAAEAKKAAVSVRRKHAMHTASIMRDRAWLLHWSLFVYFNDSNNLLDSLLSYMSEPMNMNVIQTMCPHLLRYYAAAILIADKPSYLDDVSETIVAEKENYRDPITEYVRMVTNTHDFEGASKMLRYALDVVKADFFLAYYQDYFMQYARTTFLYRYCKLYSRISVDSLSRLLLMEDMSKEDVQLWLIQAIRAEESLRNRAKLDVVENVICVYFEGTNPYQKMKDRIVRLNERTMVLVASIDTRLKNLEEAENAD